MHHLRPASTHPQLPLNNLPYSYIGWHIWHSMRRENEMHVDSCSLKENKREHSSGLNRNCYYWFLTWIHCSSLNPILNWIENGSFPSRSIPINLGGALQADVKLKPRLVAKYFYFTASLAIQFQKRKILKPIAVIGKASTDMQNRINKYASEFHNRTE